MRKAITFTAGINTHHMRYSVNSLIELEDKLKQPMFEIFKAATEGRVRLRDIRTLVWAGLIHENKQLTEQEAGEIIDEVGFNNVVELVGMAMAEAFPKVQGAAKSEGQETVNPT